MVVGRQVEDSEREPIVVEGGEIQCVKEFPYLGAVIADSGRMDADVESRLAKASKAYGALRKAVFLDRNLSLQTKRKVYQACVLSVLLYGAECWILLRRQVKKLNTFHHRCVRAVLGISNQQQWDERITMAEVRRRWGDEDLVSDKIQMKRLEWLGHLARMQDHRIPKSVLFGWLSQPRPRGGPRKRWKDVVKEDLQQISVKDEWYKLATTSRDGWRSRCREGVRRQLESRAAAAARSRSSVGREVWCGLCNRRFRREADKKRHKCADERKKPLSQQKGAVKCISCNRWFGSRGGLAVHRCHSDRQ